MKILNALVIVGGVILSGCASYAPMGVIYTQGISGQAANNNVKPIKSGKSCVTSVLGLVAWGGGGIVAAKADGNIHRVASVDYDVSNLFGLYGTYCTVVKGE